MKRQLLTSFILLICLSLSAQKQDIIRIVPEANDPRYKDLLEQADLVVGEYQRNVVYILKGSINLEAIDEYCNESFEKNAQVFVFKNGAISETLTPYQYLSGLRIRYLGSNNKMDTSSNVEFFKMRSKMSNNNKEIVCEIQQEIHNKTTGGRINNESTFQQITITFMRDRRINTLKIAKIAIAYSKIKK